MGDLEGNVLSCSGMTHIPYDAENFEPELTTEEKEAVVAYLDGFGGVFVPVVEDETAASALKEYQDGLEEIKTTVIATVPEGICFERIPGQGRSLICSPEETSAQGGGVCNLVAQAFMEQALTADFAIQNGGGCRTDIFAGDFTIDNAYSLLPFSNTIVRLAMTGSEILAVLEDALENAFNGGSTGAYPYASGLRYDVDASQSKGSRISNLEMNPRLMSSWSPIVMDDTYFVVTNDYIAGGKDGYLTFAEVAKTEGTVEDLYLEYAQAFVDYATKAGTLVDLPLENYSTKSFTPFKETKMLTILHINDHYSHLDGDDFGVDGSDAGISAEEVDVLYGGFPRIVSLFKELESSATNDVLKLHAGDAITGTTFFTLYEGKADAVMMEQVCFDAFGPGNHEFDYGDSGLAKFIEYLHASETCPDVPVVSANLVPGETSPLKPLMDSGKLAPYTISTMADGEEVGIIGINIRDKTMKSSSPDEGTVLLDEVKSATSTAAQLTAAGIKKIILLTHVGYSKDLDWLVQVPYVDIIVGGDSHSLLGSDENLAPIGFP